MEMEMLVAIDGESAVGAFLLSLRGKVGGASAHLECNGKMHPLIVATNLKWSDIPGFLRMTHIQNPGTDNLMPAEFVVPVATVLGALEKKSSAEPGPIQQQTPTVPMH